MKIWIDLDNSPHVPLFVPIIEELRARGHQIMVTARDAFQVRELADLHGLDYRLVGRHYGKHFLLKLLGVFIRGLQLLPTVIRERPALCRFSWLPVAAGRLGAPGNPVVSDCGLRIRESVGWHHADVGHGSRGHPDRGDPHKP